MKKISLYKMWLALGFTIVLLTLLGTLAFNLSLPDNCQSCEMGAIGLVPFWILSLLIAIINCITIPIYIARHKGEKGLLWIASWAYMAMSFLGLAWVAIGVVIYG